MKYYQTDICGVSKTDQNTMSKRLVPYLIQSLKRDETGLYHGADKFFLIVGDEPDLYLTKFLKKYGYKPVEVLTEPLTLITGKDLRN